jgi:bacterioferritin
MDDGAVTPNHGLDAGTVVRLLNEALATEIDCALHYRRHYFCAERSHAEYVEGDTLRHMIEENLVAERIAIESYREMLQYVADRDATTRRMLEDVLADEEEHAEAMASLLERIA